MAAGNSYTSGYKNKSGQNKPYASDPDSSVLSYPSAMPGTVAVASVNNAERRRIQSGRWHGHSLYRGEQPKLLGLPEVLGA